MSLREQKDIGKNNDDDNTALMKEIQTFPCRQKFRASNTLFRMVAGLDTPSQLCPEESKDKKATKNYSKNGTRPPPNIFYADLLANALLHCAINIK